MRRMRRMRAIDADALIAKCGNWYCEEGTEEGFIGDIKHLIDGQPTIEPETEEEAYERGYAAGQMAERKKGKWIDTVIPSDNGGLPVQVCDQCNTFFPLAYTGGGHRFCPNCGAAMTEEGAQE